MTARVTVTDRGLAKLQLQLVELRRLKITAGVQGPKGEAEHPGTDGKSVAFVAAVNEYGTDDGSIPPRPFLRHTEEITRERNRERMRKAVAAIVDGRATVVDALADVGAEVVGEIVRTIDNANSWAAPNAPSTVRRKGHNLVLRDSRTLRASITFAVRDGDRVLREG